MLWYIKTAEVEMKNIVKIVFVVFFVNFVLFSSYSLQADTPIKKLGRGVANVVTCPLEVCNGIQQVNDSDGVFAALTWGLLSGIFKTGVRAVVGVYEIISFPIPFPKDYGPILTDPEFFGAESII